MKRIIFNEYGHPGVFKVEEYNLPAITEGQLLINVSGTSVNPVDVKVRKGDLKFLTGKKFPKVPACDFCGVVIESKYKAFKKGDVVYGVLDTLKGRACAERIIIDGADCGIKPANLNESETFVLPVIGITCLDALVTYAGIKPNQKVFINGCTGGVGHFAVKMAKAPGAEVTGTCSEINSGFARSIGADRVLDYNKPLPGDLANSFDFVFDTTGKM
jgi:NADPH:quinone reductase-like Zn-dependent oxidoreductase